MKKPNPMKGGEKKSMQALIPGKKAGLKNIPKKFPKGK
jgi:hypothetical protein